ncbi:mitochondrial translation initiation factor IF-2 [Aspergillus luchuensis]|uniref:Mitochondrial translation initiation factor IF-2 n=1 Tax=Aspergillus kawachii TaxID=1069201 RepID=A0A146FG07_ASPKA|nr:mitochondrial translation initiation factor IF-2 [Aspergillus luchuensis]
MSIYIFDWCGNKLGETLIKDEKRSSTLVGSSISASGGCVDWECFNDGEERKQTWPAPIVVHRSASELVA